MRRRSGGELADPRWTRDTLAVVELVLCCSGRSRDRGPAQGALPASVCSLAPAHHPHLSLVPPTLSPTLLPTDRTDSLSCASSSSTASCPSLSISSSWPSSSSSSPSRPRPPPTASRPHSAAPSRSRSASPTSSVSRSRRARTASRASSSRRLQRSPLSRASAPGPRSRSWGSTLRERPRAEGGAGAPVAGAAARSSRSSTTRRSS